MSHTAPNGLRAVAVARRARASATVIGVFPLVVNAFEVAGIPYKPGFLGLDVRILKSTFRWANRIRPRYSVLDFFEGQGSSKRRSMP